ENEKIFRENNLQEIKGSFKKFIEKVPIFIKENEKEGYFIEIILRHKQRAVGLQAMVYLCIYVEKLKDKNGNSLIGRQANIGEFGQLEITPDNRTIILDTIKAFTIASLQHKNDISNILEQIKRKWKL
ncbi:MAG: R.Pab1 family restriction endonuclease, partial [Candidatus Aenigmatarchaeota archaeon]